MSISSLDFISPKITLKYNGRNSHVSRIGGFLSLCLSLIICIFGFYCLWSLFEPRFFSSFLYEENTIDNKLLQNINYSGINHFLQIYSHLDNGWFGEFDNRNLMIYAVKENNKLYNNNNLNLELPNTEHWLYDRCNKISNMNLNLFDEISKYVKNYSSLICIRFYFNPNDKKYYEIGSDGYVEPYLETSKLNEKKYPFKIIIEKCLNNSFININIGQKCKSEIDINKYFEIYDEIFIYFLYNQIMPLSSQNQIKKNIYSISDKLGQLSFFTNDIIFQPIKIMKAGSFINAYKNSFSFWVYNNIDKFQKSNINENGNLLGIYNIYLNSNIITYQIRFSNLIDILSHLGGLIKIFFLIFKILNYINHQYIIIENSQELFKINTGIESNFNEAKDRAFDLTIKNVKINHMNSNINEDNSIKFLKEFSPVNNKKKFKLFEGASPKEKQSSKLNMPLYPINISSNKRNNIIKKNTNIFDAKNRDKRKSYLSQVYSIKRKDTNIYIKNKSQYEKNKSNNEIISNKGKNKNYNNENISIIFNHSKKSNNEFSPSKKSNNEYNPLKKRKSKRYLNSKIPSNKIIHDKIDNYHFGLKSHKERHKSINYSNQKKFFRYSIFSRNQTKIQNPSELINDSSKQILVNSKNLIPPFNRHQNDKNKFYEKNLGTRTINDITEYANSSKNFQTFTLNKVNSNIDINFIFKSFIKNKLKKEVPEGKEGFTKLINQKIIIFDFLKSFFISRKKSKNKVNLINNFRNKLLSEEHLYKNHINLYAIQKIFQIEEAYKFDFTELYNNL